MTGRSSVGGSSLDGTSNGDEQLTLICAGVGPSTNLQRLGIKSSLVSGTGSVGRFRIVEKTFCGIASNGLMLLRDLADMLMVDVGGRGCFISVMDVGIGK